MSAIEAVKASNPIEHVIEADLGPPARRSRSKLFWRCPVHGDKSPSLVVYPADGGGDWFCFGCQVGGDVFDYLQWRRGGDFKTAFQALAGAKPPRPGGRTERRRLVVQVAQHPPQDWQDRASRVIADCAAELWSPAGKRALAWLRNERGLSKDTLCHWWIGFNDAGGRDSAWRHGLKIRRGVVIPIWSEREQTFWRLKVRRPVGEPKYMTSWPDGSAFLWGVDNLEGHDLAFLCESELDGLLLQQMAGDLVAVVAQGSAGEAKRKNMVTWLPYLLHVSRLFVATDADESGERAAGFWLSQTRRARRARPPGGATDVTDAWRAGADLQAWVLEMLEVAA